MHICISPGREENGGGSVYTFIYKRYIQPRKPNFFELTLFDTLDHFERLYSSSPTSIAGCRSDGVDDAVLAEDLVLSEPRLSIFNLTLVVANRACYLVSYSVPEVNDFLLFASWLELHMCMCVDMRVVG
jgi:hypothetical protein